MEGISVGWYRAVTLSVPQRTRFFLPPWRALASSAANTFGAVRRVPDDRYRGIGLRWLGRDGTGGKSHGKTGVDVLLTATCLFLFPLS